ncbi:hypothetical protein SKAU_G00207500 [Synaphobranchus kaupii]|uniref:HAT C-terminal dimerisation domain-containing protein n=1 Tax=Synaphobranchus kaupii TaxID=118154 RepID=A0A9Q1F873_SYNKA|nr:hypothetical protein SKAU_G00207500 [Synaphobranchus kaupii]
MSNQWGLLEKTITVLALFEEFTRELSSSSALAADVIPTVTVLKRLLAQVNEANQGIKTLKSTLLESMNRRFTNMESEPLYSVATLLDPRYKDRYFTSSDTSKQGKDALIQEVEKMEEALRAVSEPEEKAPRVHASSTAKSSLGSLFDKILQEHGTEPVQASTSALVEVQTNLSEKTIPWSDKPLEYWRTNQPRFPSLAATASKFLCAPCTCMESERLFSAASNIVDERRNRLTAERAEMLLFLKKNLPQ